MASIAVSPNATIAAQQLATERDKIRLNTHLRPDAKEWHIKRLEKAFADAQYGQTLSPPARLGWVLVSLPLIVLRNLYDMPNILQYGVYGGHGQWGDLQQAQLQQRQGGEGGGAMIEDVDETAVATTTGEHERDED